MPERKARHNDVQVLKSLVANMPGMAYRRSAEDVWRPLFISDGAHSLTGYPVSALMAGSPSYLDLIHPDDLGRLNSEVGRARTLDGRFQLEYRIQTPGGQKWAQEHGVILTDGSRNWLEGFVTDVSEAKQVRREFDRLNATLERRVEQRTEELKAANEELKSLSAALAHDLRGPISAIAMMTKLLIAKQHEPQQRLHYLQRIEAGITHIDRLTDSLLSLTRLSGVALDIREHDLASLAGEALQQLLPTRLLSPQIRLPAALPARGDSRLLRMALTHLLDNAMKFSGENVVIEIGQRLLPTGGRVFFVRDDGIGFDMDRAHVLFQPFQRLHEPGEYEGTGIGLAIVHKVITMHGGKIWAESEPGKGTTVFFTTEPGQMTAESL